MSYNFNYDGNWYAIDALIDLFNELSTDKANIELVPNQPRYNKLSKLVPEFTSMLKKSNGDELKIKVLNDEMTQTALHIIIRGEVISIDDPQILSELSALADCVEVYTLTTGESELAFSFENVWDLKDNPFKK